MRIKKKRNPLTFSNLLRHMFNELARPLGVQRLQLLLQVVGRRRRRRRKRKRQNCRLVAINCPTGIVQLQRRTNGLLSEHITAITDNDQQVAAGVAEVTGNGRGVGSSWATVGRWFARRLHQPTSLTTAASGGAAGGTGANWTGTARSAEVQFFAAHAR